MKRPTRKKKTLGKEGKALRQQIISGHQAEINKLQGALKKTADPTQKKLLAKQIMIEQAALQRFIRGKP